jgi:hypothetical protein
VQDGGCSAGSGTARLNAASRRAIAVNKWEILRLAVVTSLSLHNVATQTQNMVSMEKVR